MAGNNTLRILRCDSSKKPGIISDNSQVLLAGQPLYDEGTKLLRIGNGSEIKNTVPIQVRPDDVKTDAGHIFFTEIEQNKLAGIQEGAQVNPPIDEALSSTSVNAVQNKVINLALSDKVSLNGNQVITGTKYFSASETQMDELRMRGSNYNSRKIYFGDTNGVYLHGDTSDHLAVYSKSGITFEGIDSTTVFDFNVGTLKEQGQRVYSPNNPQPVSLDDMSWEQISKISKAGEAPSVFHVGQEKKILLSTGETVTAVILGFNHDDLPTREKAGITFGLKNCLSKAYTMNTTATNVGGWGSSAMATKMATFKSYLPLTLQSVIRWVHKQTSAGDLSTAISVSTDDLFLFSHVEIFGTNYLRQNVESAISVMSSSSKNEGKQYDYYKGKTWVSNYGKTTVNSFGRVLTFIADVYYQENSFKGWGDRDTAARYWWLRSPAASNYTGFCRVTPSGYADDAGGEADISSGVCFGFCV